MSDITSVQKEHAKEVAVALSSYIPRLKVLSGGGDDQAKAIIAAIQTCADANPLLYQCTRESLRNAALLAAQTGLLPSVGAKAKAYIVPRQVKGQWTANYSIGVWGFYALALQSGFLKDAWWDVVYEGDTFKETKGLHRNLTHEPGPNYDTSPDLITHVYCCYETATGGKGFTVLNKARVERLRLMNPAEKKGGYSPWTEWYAEMACAKVVRHTLATLPHARTMQVAIAAEDAATTGDNSIIAGYVDIETALPAPTKGTDALKKKIQPVSDDDDPALRPRDEDTKEEQ